MNCQLFLTTIVEKGEKRMKTENEKHEKKADLARCWWSL